MKYLRISLRTFLILLTLFAVWLGYKVNKRREQREIVEMIREMGGSVWYDSEAIRKVILR